MRKFIFMFNKIIYISFKIKDCFTFQFNGSRQNRMHDGAFKAQFHHFLLVVPIILLDPDL